MADHSEPEKPQRLVDTSEPEVPLSVEVRHSPEISAPMLEVHPAHHAASTWREFFIHIATIVLGLLIAIGLEQTVEYIHHLRELHAAREELRSELEEDIAIADRDLKAIHDLQARLNTDVALLLARRATNNPLTGRLDFTWTFTRTRFVALKSNQLSGSLTLMPHGELERYDFLFSVNEAIMAQTSDWNSEVEVAKAIAARSPDGELTPLDTHDLISAISETQGKLAFTERLIGFFQASVKLWRVDLVESARRS
jgi:hypothetical protein